jgi:hypothetical protein
MESPTNGRRIARKERKVRVEKALKRNVLIDFGIFIGELL